jgi:adenine-specific DNA-methyltransferase
MNNSIKEKRFLDALESLFTGAEVDGNSGFVNLMRIKRGYFRSVRPKLMAAIDQRAEKDSAFREELFDKLYTFFSRYFCESGSIYFRHLPAFSKTYERVYADGEDIALSWKTQMLYYVKSDMLVRSMPVELNEEGKPQDTRRFYFDASDVEHKKNNERRELIFDFGEVKRTKEGRVVHLKVSYSQRGKKTKTDDIIKQSHKGGVSLSEDELQKAIDVFRRQAEVDFFINKDARGFLREQFDMWMYQYIFQEETVFEEQRIKQLQSIKATAYDIIDFIAQFEDELRRVWEKPKFVRNVNYVVTLDKLTDKILNKITKHNGADAQIREWRELDMVDDEFSMASLKNGSGSDYKFLPLDTKHFKDLELEILGVLGNLDKALDGELIHSENWQALNSLQKRYKERVKCIYIDPPYNAKSSEIPYINTYKQASWLSLMADRLKIGKLILGANAPQVISIDEVEQELLGQVISQEFPKWCKVCVPIVHNPRGQQGKNVSYIHEFAFFIFPNDKEKYIADVLKNEIDSRNLRDSGTESDRTDAESCFYPFIVKNKKIIKI